MVKVFKPKGTLKAGDQYKTKIELASEIITALVEEGFEIELVLADSLYGESREFLKKLEAYNLAYVGFRPDRLSQINPTKLTLLNH